MTPEELASWRGSYRGLQSGRTDNCPDEEILASLVLGEIDAVDREDLADHVVSCRHCSDAIRDLLRLHRAASGDRSCHLVR